jgi:hypothetical protein
MVVSVICRVNLVGCEVPWYLGIRLAGVIFQVAHPK